MVIPASQRACLGVSLPQELAHPGEVHGHEAHGQDVAYDGERAQQAHAIVRRLRKQLTMALRGVKHEERGDGQHAAHAKRSPDHLLGARGGDLEGERVEDVVVAVNGNGHHQEVGDGGVAELQEAHGLAKDRPE